MDSAALFWLAAAAIIALTALWAWNNRCQGWRRRRPGAELIELWEELLEGDSTPVVRLAPRTSLEPSASLAALEAALRSPAPAGAPAPPESYPQSARLAAQ